MSVWGRLTGKAFKEMNSRIRKIDSAIQIMEAAMPDNGHAWLAWYHDILKEFQTAKDYKKHLKIMRFMPNALVPVKIRNKSEIQVQEILNRAFMKITNDHKIKLNDVCLPIPEYSSGGGAEWFHMIFDSLLPYLLSDIDKETIYSLYTQWPLYTEGPYEYQDIRLKKGDIVIDAGANLGDFSALGSVKGCTVYAFEPVPYIIDRYLSKTASNNPHITICQYALAADSGELIMYANPSEFQETATILQTGSKGGQEMKIQAVDLDTFVERNHLPRIDFIKADIEGAERFMLRGAKKVLKEFAPKLAICTYHLPDDPKVLRELILEANANYIITERWKKMYAYVPQRYGG